jgi:hypothetical protein
MMRFAIILPLFDILTLVDKEDIEKGVEYIQIKVMEDKSIKRGDKMIFEEYLDAYFKNTWLKKD